LKSKTDKTNEEIYDEKELIKGYTEKRNKLKDGEKLHPKFYWDIVPMVSKYLLTISLIDIGFQICM
jgi:hypothetical protein